METFVAFLVDRGITAAPAAASGVETLEDIVSANFDSLKEKDLRELAGQAIKARDANAARGQGQGQGEGKGLLGEWALILDAVHAETRRRQGRAQQTMGQLVSAANTGELKLLNKLITKLLPDCDNMLMEIMHHTILDRQKAKDEENVNMLTYISKEILSQRVALAKGIDLDKMHISSSGSGSRGGDGDGEDEEDEGPDEETLQYEREMVQAGDILKSMMTESAGDVSRLSVIASRLIAEGKIGDAFVQVLTDNISACQAARYVNKLKVLTFLKSLVLKELEATSVKTGNTTYHAPQFTGDRFRDDGTGEMELVLQDGSISFIETGTLSEALLKTTGLKGKKKGLKSVGKKKLDQLCKSAAEHLDEHKWAVCDHFLPLELVRRVRIEAQLFRDQVCIV
jgi:hypothetical protein